MARQSLTRTPARTHYRLFLFYHCLLFSIHHLLSSVVFAKESASSLALLCAYVYACLAAYVYVWVRVSLFLFCLFVCLLVCWCRNKFIFIHAVKVVCYHAFISIFFRMFFFPWICDVLLGLLVFSFFIL